MKKKNKRLLTLSLLMTMVSLGFFILLSSLRENLIFFYSPSEVFEKSFEQKKKLELVVWLKIKAWKKKLKK